MLYTPAAPAVIALDWYEFKAKMRRKWGPGQHIANIGPTGEGKTTLNVGLLDIRKYVFALDAKGEDDTLSASGWTRVRHLEPDLQWWQAWQRAKWGWSPDARTWRDTWEAIEDGQPARLIVGGKARGPAEDIALRELLTEAIAFVRYSGGWTIYIDEFEVLSSQQMLALGPAVSRLLTTARAAGTSVVTSFQAAAWVPKHATRQARYAIMYSTGDRDMIRNVARGMGRDWHELAEAVDELPKFFCLVIPRGKNGGPMMLVKAPKVY